MAAEVGLNSLCNHLFTKAVVQLSESASVKNPSRVINLRLLTNKKKIQSEKSTVPSTLAGVTMHFLPQATEKFTLLTNYINGART